MTTAAKIMDRAGNALEEAMKAIRREFGEMSILRLGERPAKGVEAVSTGALSLDLALGVGGLPKGRIVELSTNSAYSMSKKDIFPHLKENSIHNCKN